VLHFQLTMSRQKKKSFSKKRKRFNEKERKTLNAFDLGTN
jgi:hypothetical protein